MKEAFSNPSARDGFNSGNWDKQRMPETKNPADEQALALFTAYNDGAERLMEHEVGKKAYLDSLNELYQKAVALKNSEEISLEYEKLMHDVIIWIEKDRDFVPRSGFKE